MSNRNKTSQDIEAADDAPPRPEPAAVPTKRAFVDAGGVLRGHGYAESNGDGMTAVDVDADFEAELGSLRWDGSRWVPYSAPVTAEQAKASRDALLAEAALRINPLQDAADLDDATAAEAALLKKWKQYRVSLGRVEQQAGFPAAVQWPERPE